MLGVATSLLCVAGGALVPSSAAAAAAAAAAPAAPCRTGTVSLTFDDGPSSAQTPRLVRILKRADVPATFFMVGQRVDASPATTRFVARSGNLIANHSYAHADMTSQSSAQVAATLRSTDAALRRAGVVPTRLMRPPYGAINDSVRATIRRTGYVPVLWDIDSRDWTGISSSTIASRILGSLRPHSSNVVLQHDGVGNSPASISAVPRIIREARRRGYCFVALDERGRPGFPTPTASLSVSTPRVAEGRPVRLSLTLDKPTARATSLRVLAVDKKTGAPAGSVRVAFRAGRTSARASLPTTRDGLDGPTRRLDLRLASPRGLRVKRGRQRVVVRDADPAPLIDGVDRRAAEPTSGATTVPVRFRLDRVSLRRISVVVETRPGTAGPGDVQPLRRRVMVPAGSRRFEVDVTLLPDSAGEGPETEESFTVVLGSTRFARVGRPATVTITPARPS